VNGIAGRIVGKLREERKAPLSARISDLKRTAWDSGSDCLGLVDLVRSVDDEEGVRL
jgi:hypothetical protein